MLTAARAPAGDQGTHRLDWGNVQDHTGPVARTRQGETTSVASCVLRRRHHLRTCVRHRYAAFVRPGPPGRIDSSPPNHRQPVSVVPPKTRQRSQLSVGLGLARRVVLALADALPGNTSQDLCALRAGFDGQGISALSHSSHADPESGPISSPEQDSRCWLASFDGITKKPGGVTATGSCASVKQRLQRSG